jgi:hypothetical protein
VRRIIDAIMTGSKPRTSPLALPFLEQRPNVGQGRRHTFVIGVCGGRRAVSDDSDQSTGLKWPPGAVEKEAADIGRKPVQHTARTTQDGGEFRSKSPHHASDDGVHDLVAALEVAA